MKICMVGDFSEVLDEGYKNTGHYLASALSEGNTVVKLNAKQIYSPAFWTVALRAQPEIIHTIARPTNQSLLLTRLLAQLHPRACTVVSALKAETYFTKGEPDALQRRLVPVMRPDLVLVQNDRAEAQFSKLGCTVAHLPNGVDLDRFRPASDDRKHELRLKYGIRPDQPVVLHVGHLEAARNLDSLAGLPPAGFQVIVAGSLYMGTNTELIHNLESLGFFVLKGYQSKIEELYMLADCYIFTPRPGSSLTMPLSVLEAMACNLPVITTRFSGLIHAFAQGEGLTFVDDMSNVPANVRAALASAGSCTTRRKVETYSWRAISDKLIGYYQKLVQA